MKYLPLKILPLFVAIALLSTLSCISKRPRPLPENSLPPKTAAEISIMNYNVENLFDNIHDENREDQTYLPLAKKQTLEHKALCEKLEPSWLKDECLNLDWSDEVVNAKLKNIAQIINSVDDGGPDILILEEVENERILTRLNREFLSRSGYITQVLVEGPDKRGIDIALLSRLPLNGKPTLHQIPYVGENEEDVKWMARSRGILEVPLITPAGESLVVLGAHFPSQKNPRYWRKQAVNNLKGMIAGKEKKLMVIAGGDLNITSIEENETGFFKGILSQVALISHLDGCKSCAGTHNYKNSWSFLDVLMFSKNMGPMGTAPYFFAPESVQVITSSDRPRRFNVATKVGASDHFPLYARIRRRN